MEQTKEKVKFNHNSHMTSQCQMQRNHNRSNQNHHWIRNIKFPRIYKRKVSLLILNQRIVFLL